MNPRVGIYARQSAKVDEGVERQIELGKQFALERGWEVVDTYADNAVSATKDRRGDTRWTALLADIDAGRVDTVLAVDLDRLTRSLYDLVQLRGRDRMARIVIIRAGLDTDVGAADEALALLASMSHREILIKSQRAKPYRDARRASGHASPGLTVFGYAWVPAATRKKLGDETRYVINPEEAKHVRFMFEEALAGASIGSIVRTLNDRGIRTRPSKRHPEGTQWLSSTVRRILLNPFLAGLLPPVQETHYDTNRVDLELCQPGAWEPIVTKDEAVAVRARLMAPERRTQRGNDRRWLLSGLAKCGVCGGPVVSCRTKEGLHGYRCVTGHFQRRGDILDEAVAQTIIYRLALPDAASLIRPKAEVDIPALQARQRAIETRVQKLVDLVALHDFSWEQIKEQKALLDIEAATTSRELADALTNDPLAEIVTADDVNAKWRSLSLGRQREIARLMLTPVLHPVGKGVRVTTVKRAWETMHYEWRKFPGVEARTLPIDREALAALFASSEE